MARARARDRSRSLVRGVVTYYIWRRSPRRGFEETLKDRCNKAEVTTLQRAARVAYTRAIKEAHFAHDYFRGSEKSAVYPKK